MKLLITSDWHLGKGWKDEAGVEWGERVARDIIQYTSFNPVDAFLFNGDLGNTQESQKKGLELLALASEGIPKKMFVSGNHELLLLPDQFEDRYEDLQERLFRYNFHLLDHSSAWTTLGKTAFVGGCGWYDGSLWTPYGNNTYAEVFTKAKEEFAKRFPVVAESHDPLEFFQYSLTLLNQRLEEIRGMKWDNIIVCTHHAPDSQFIDYKEPLELERPLKSDERYWNYLNFFMGSRRLSALYNKAEKMLNPGGKVIGVTGHTHRSDAHLVNDRFMVYNASATKEKPFQVIEV
ncbi:MAG: metallophosphoesterase [Candidatus Woesearchaeota archaeon]|jgi:3',5'-cyclic AMP phosphodiesterase CpdA